MGRSQKEKPVCLAVHPSSIKQQAAKPAAGPQAALATERSEYGQTLKRPTFFACACCFCGCALACPGQRLGKHAYGPVFVFRRAGIWKIRARSPMYNAVGVFIMVPGTPCPRLWHG